MHMQYWKHTGSIWILAATKTSTGFISDKEPSKCVHTEYALGLCRSPDLPRITCGHHTYSCCSVNWNLHPLFRAHFTQSLNKSQKEQENLQAGECREQCLWLELCSLLWHQYMVVIFSWVAISSDVTRIISRRANCTIYEMPFVTYSIPWWDSTTVLPQSLANHTLSWNIIWSKQNV